MFSPYIFISHFHSLHYSFVSVYFFCNEAAFGVKNVEKLCLNIYSVIVFFNTYYCHYIYPNMFL